MNPILGTPPKRPLALICHRGGRADIQQEDLIHLMLRRIPLRGQETLSRALTLTALFHNIDVYVHKIALLNIAYKATRRVQREHVVEVVLVELVAFAAPLKDAAHEAVLEAVFGYRLRVVQHAPAADEVFAVAVVLEVCDYAVEFLWGMCKAAGGGDRRALVVVGVVKVVGSVAEGVNFKLGE